MHVCKFLLKAWKLDPVFWLGVKISPLFYFPVLPFIVYFRTYFPIKKTFEKPYKERGCQKSLTKTYGLNEPIKMG